MSIVLIDDHQMVWQTIRVLLEAAADVQVLHEGATGQEATRMVEKLSASLGALVLNLFKRIGKNIGVF